MTKVGINGFGIMGRYLVRAIQKEVNEGKLNEGDIEVVAINDLFAAEQLTPLLAHDTVYHAFPGKVEQDGKDILINGKRIDVSAEKDPAKLNWADRGVDIVYESTGVFAKRPGVEGHLDSGAKKVIYSVPSKFAEVTIVMGVDEDKYNGQDIVSNASCTTNCLAPLAEAMRRTYGDFDGLMTTIHAYTADQRLQDAPHSDVARAYAAAENMIPTTTGAAKAIGSVIDSLDGRLDGGALRVPIPVVSIVDLTADIGQKVSADEVNTAMKAAAEGFPAGTFEYREGPVVSSMMTGYHVPSVFDASQTKTKGNMAKVFSWYDNVAGYSHQAVKLIQLIGKE